MTKFWNYWLYYRFCSYLEEKWTCIFTPTYIFTMCNYRQVDVISNGATQCPVWDSFFPIYTIMWCFARFGIICTILKTWKTPMEECHFWWSCRVKACNFTKSNTPPCMFFKFSKLYKWYRIAPRIITDSLLPDATVHKCSIKSFEKSIRKQSWRRHLLSKTALCSPITTEKKT